MTKIDIVSGFLGAGKTTLIKKLLSEGLNKEKIVLIENEYGEIGIDGAFLKDSGIEIREMNSGCICCSLVGDFGSSLKEVITKYAPERIIIEPSGVGKLSDVMKAVADNAGDLDCTLNSAVAVVDAVKAKMYMKNFGEFFNDQIEAANAIILSRTDKLSQEKIEAVVALIKEHNTTAHIITTPWNDLSYASILEAMEGKDAFADLLEELRNRDKSEEEEHHHHHHDHDEECDCHHDHEHEHEHEHEHHHHDHDEECDCHHDHEHDHHHHDGETCSCGHHHGHGHHHADDVFTSIGFETPKKYAKAELEDILAKLSEKSEYGVILRAKGMLPSDDVENGKFLHFDLTPGEYEVRVGAAEYTGRICVIGSLVNEDKVKELFKLN